MRPFLGNGLGNVCAEGKPKSTSPPGPAENGACGLPNPPRLLFAGPGIGSPAILSEKVRFREVLGDGS